MGARGGFRMVLHTKNRLGSMLQSFNRPIIEIYPVHFHLRWQRSRIYGKSMILGSNLDMSRFQVFDWLISSPMPKF